MRTLSAHDVALVLPTDEPLLFVGPPGAVRGRLQLQNTGEARMSLRGATVRPEGLPVADAPFVAVLAPGSRTTATAVLSMDPATAPGTYMAEVDLGGHHETAKVVVLASTEVDLAPSRVVVQAQSSESTVVLRNDGNVDVSIVPLVRADLRRDGRRDVDDAEAATVVGRLPGPLRLAPGRSAVLTLTVELPDGLDPTRRYVAELPLGPAVLTVVVPPGATAPKQVPAPARKRTPARRAPTTRRSS